MIADESGGNGSGGVSGAGRRFWDEGTFLRGISRGSLL